jgi:GTPase SAR1 family protein
MCDCIIKILLLGNPTKKTRTLVKSWFKCFEEDYKRTLGVAIYKKEVIYQEVNVSLIAWEMFFENGRFNDLHHLYFQGSSGALYIIDESSAASFQDLDEWLSLIQYEVGNNPKEYPLLLIRSISIEEESPHFKNILAEKLKWFRGCFKCNFITGDHVEEIFQEITKLILEKWRQEMPFELQLK